MNLQNLHAIDSLARHANFNPLLFCLWRWSWRFYRLGFIIRFDLPNWKRLDPLDANETPFAGVVMSHKAHSTQIILFVVCVGIVEQELVTRCVDAVATMLHPHVCVGLAHLLPRGVHKLSGFVNQLVTILERESFQFLSHSIGCHLSNLSWV